ncbi:MAG: hypothetical protein A2539_03440 [Elusimicrobia bacterium RIFOXYD2_FULL_34_15]|nr:MAG: hypothetical protein A2539_03440 [Elusimicrobia bacterium RIFOXYD2_FULL_34_15]
MVSKISKFLPCFLVFGLLIGITYAQTTADTTKTTTEQPVKKEEPAKAPITQVQKEENNTTPAAPVVAPSVTPAPVSQTPITPAVTPTPASTPSNGKTKVAVMDFESIGRNIKENDLGLSVADNLRTILFKTGKFDVVERNYLMKLLEEQKLQMSGIVDSDTAVQIGKLSGAGKLIVGSVSKIGTKYTINSRLIDIKSGSVEKAESLGGYSEDDIPNMIEDIAKLLMGDTVTRPKIQTAEKKQEPVIEPVKPVESPKKPDTAKKDESDSKKRAAVDLDIGIKAGAFYLLDSKLSKDFSLGFLWGGTASLWITRIGLQYEYEKYNNTGERTQRTNNGINIVTTKTNTEMDLTPGWFSLLIRGNYDNASMSYGYIGVGMGSIKSEKTVTVNNVALPTVSDTFSGQQFLIGFNGKHAGLCVKYSKISTNARWADVDLGGLSATLGLFF